MASHDAGDVVLAAYDAGDVVLAAHDAGDVVLAAHGAVLVVHDARDAVLAAHDAGDAVLAVAGKLFKLSIMRANKLVVCHFQFLVTTSVFTKKYLISNSNLNSMLKYIHGNGIKYEQKWIRN